VLHLEDGLKWSTKLKPSAPLRALRGEPVTGPSNRGGRRGSRRLADEVLILILLFLLILFLIFILILILL
jgi:hypothetical protein